MTGRERLFLALIVLAWAGNFLASAEALSRIPPFWFTLLRFLVVLAALLPCLAPVPRSQWPRLFLVCLCTGALHLGLNFWALAEGGIGVVAILLQSYVPLSALLAWCLLGERIGWRGASGIAIAFLGVVAIGLARGEGAASSAALVLSLLAALLLALGTVAMRALSGISALSLQAWNALLGIPVLLPLALLLEGPPEGFLPAVEPRHWAGVLYSALAASILGHGLLYALLRHHPVAAITPHLLLTPVVAIGLAALFGREQPGATLLAGGALVLGGSLMVARRARSRASRPGPSAIG
ncbi:MAG: DMT family transporter [Xanthomonadales bacterium]|nr:DMT family transporter [Xanthomonadales bacterium]